MASRIDADDLALCRRLLQGGSRSFFAASLLLPRRVMEPATALYAFCRVADDLIDDVDETCGGQAGGGQAGGACRAGLAALRRRLDGIYAGRPEMYPTDRALAAVVEGHQLPRALLDGLLEGFAWDAEGRQYEDLAALQAYAARVAGTVGAMMSVLMGARSPELVARACDLGIAMQLSNIARDVGEDAGRGRLYLPRRWLREVGVDPDAWLAAPRFTPAIGEVVRRLVTAADALYARADNGIGNLPLDCRPGIGAARRLYAAIGHRVLRQGGNSVDGRAVVSSGAKLVLLGRAVGRGVADTVLAAPPLAAPPVPAARFLVAAVAAQPGPRPQASRLEWLVDLFASLDSRQGVQPAGRS